jgi:hypothetical protein
MEASASTHLAGLLLGVGTEFNITEELDAILSVNYGCVFMYVGKVLDITVQKPHELLKNVASSASGKNSDNGFPYRQ